MIPGYATNEKDAANLATDAHRAKIVKSLTAGIVVFRDAMRPGAQISTPAPLKTEPQKTEETAKPEPDKKQTTEPKKNSKPTATKSSSKQNKKSGNSKSKPKSSSKNSNKSRRRR